MTQTYYQKNREKILEKRKQRYDNLTPDEKREYIKGTTYWGKENPEKFKESRRKWLEKNPTYQTYNNARRRSKELGLDFDIHYTDIVFPEVCPILGITLVRELVNGQGDMTARPELDRIDSTKGYVKGNIQIISARANRIKNDGTAEEHRKIAEYMDKYS